MTVTQICYNKVKFLILFNTRFSRYSTFIKTLANQRFTKNSFFFSQQNKGYQKKNELMQQMALYGTMLFSI